MYSIEWLLFLFFSTIFWIAIKWLSLHSQWILICAGNFLQFQNLRYNFELKVRRIMILWHFFLNFRLANRYRWLPITLFPLSIYTKTWFTLAVQTNNTILMLVFNFFFVFTDEYIEIKINSALIQRFWFEHR